MPVLLFNSPALQINIRYLWQKGSGSSKSPYYFRRRIPKDIIDIYASHGQTASLYHAVALRTRDLQLAAKWVSQINRKLEEEWHKLRQGQSIEAAQKASQELLSTIGLESMAIQAQRHKHEEEAELLTQLQRNASAPADTTGPLPEFERHALQVVSGKYEKRLSDAKENYLKNRERTRKLCNTTDRSFEMVTDILGDRPLNGYKRRDVAEVIRQALTSGLKTATVRKRLGTVRAAVKELIRDHELEGVKNAFSEFKIPNNGEDAEKRNSLSSEQLQKMRGFIRKEDHKDSTSADILGLLTDTGARLSEVVGLRREDVVLDAEVPHIHIRPNPLRRLKTKNSTRVVPLIGDALFAAQRAMQSATDSFYLFPKYMPEAGIKNDLASAALRKIMKHRDCLTPHSLRHTMRTRLRNANIPQPRVDELQGWTDGSMANYYGEGTALKLLQADLLKSLQETVASTPSR